MGLPSTPIVTDPNHPTSPVLSTVVNVGVSVQVGLVHAATFKDPLVKS